MLQRTSRLVVNRRGRGELCRDDRQRFGRVLHQGVDIPDFDTEPAPIQNKRAGAARSGGVAPQLPRQQVHFLFVQYRYRHVQPQTQDGR